MCCLATWLLLAGVTCALGQSIPISPDARTASTASSPDRISRTESGATDAAGNILPPHTQPPQADSEDSPKVTLASLPKNLLVDQQAFWTLPLHLNTKDLSFVVPAAFSTALLIGSDTALQPYLPKSPNTIRMAANASTAGMAALLGTGAGLFVWGQATHDQHKRETGLLTGEAAIDAYAAATAIKYMTQRERPNTGNGKGSFFVRGRFISLRHCGGKLGRRNRHRP